MCETNNGYVSLGVFPRLNVLDQLLHTDSRVGCDRDREDGKLGGGNEVGDPAGERLCRYKVSAAEDEDDPLVLGRPETLLEPGASEAGGVSCIEGVHNGADLLRVDKVVQAATECRSNQGERVGVEFSRDLALVLLFVVIMLLLLLGL